MYPTLVRISNALELDGKNRAQLLHLAGYEVGPPLPDEGTVERVLAHVTVSLNREPFPVALVDDSERMWYCNVPHFRLWGEWLGFANHHSYMASLKGKRWIDFMFDPDIGTRRLPPFVSANDEADEMLMRQVALHWRAYYRHMEDPDLIESIATLKRNADFARRWEAFERGYGDFLFIDHITYTVHHPRFGALKLATWKTRLALDDRFLVAYVSAADSPTSRILDDWLAS